MRKYVRYTELLYSTRVCLKVYWKNEDTWRYMKLKYLNQLRKKTSIFSSWSRSHSPIDNCSLFILYKVEYKSQATSYKYMLCSHSLQHSFFSRSAKPADGFKQLNGDRGNSLPPLFLLLVSAPKIQIHSDFGGCTSKSFLFSLSASFFAVLLCEILESRWVFKSVHRKNVLIFHSSSPFARWQF